MTLRIIALVLAAASVAHAAPDLAAELRATAAQIRLKDDPGTIPVAARGCFATTQAERAALTKRVLAWIDTAHPDERGPSVPDDTSLVVTFGCKDSAGAVVLDISQDREPAKPRPNAFGTPRNYLLKITTTIEVIAEDTSTPSPSWMEWADLGRIQLLAQVDLDGDRVLDIVYANHEREGGAIDAYDFLQVRYASGRRADSAQIVNLADVRLVNDQLVVAGRTRNDQLFYGCLGRDLLVAPCPTAGVLQRAADRRALHARYREIQTGDLPDRDLLGRELAALGVPAKRRAALVAMAAETHPVIRAQREVTAFLVSAGLVEPTPMPEIVQQAHPQARKYLDELAATLGDAPCTATPLTDADRSAASAWVKKQDAKAADVVMAEASCGPYTWIAWTSSTRTDAKRRQVLISRDGTTRILGFTYEQEMGEIDLAQDDRWFTHDGAFVGIVIANENLWVVSGNKVVAQSKGAVAFYRADDRWGETSIDVFVDGGTLWRATPTGREKLDRALVRDHEARRAAIALLLNASPSGDPTYLGALKLLGADAALIAECKRLWPPSLAAP